MTSTSQSVCPSSAVEAVPVLKNVTNQNRDPARPRPKVKTGSAAEDLCTVEPVTTVCHTLDSIDPLTPPVSRPNDPEPVNPPQPKWSKDYQREVRKILCDGSEKNLEMVNKAYGLEKKFKLKPDLKGLSPTKQPAAIKWLVERGHDFTTAPPLTKLVEGQRSSAKTTAEAFASVFLPYYNSVMPPCRRAKGETLGKPIQPIAFSQWKQICRCGMNGIALLVQGFAWWYHELNPNAETNETDSDKYTAAVKDFIWVLDCLTEGVDDGSVTWIDEAEVVARRGRGGGKRPVASLTDGAEKPRSSKRAKI